MRRKMPRLSMLLRKLRVIHSTIMNAAATKSGSEGPASSSAICESSNNRTCSHSSFTSSRTCVCISFLS
ncbi:hypothetical protein POPTR_012G124633v4 [Populus trichocarpa]|uniref:Uncharacterized protein n=1 Tax=Populus trichocarpa TaxID=3694 RepID=A0ACC0S732_POPTR|nr:hypothetical protein BDE02_12G101800 [Populus trichocarpa]KAI9384900.1 hypothetical protein POPTR_012G124633v4 [Populus trichocarpa]